MPSIQLPSFHRDSVVQDDISEFLERIIQQTSHLPAETRLSLLEQQCVGDWPRSVLSIAKTTEEKLNICIQRLRAEFGESKKLGKKIAKDCPTFVISQFISKVNPLIAQHLVVKASEFETLDKIVEAACRVELSFQTPPTTSNTNQSLDEWKVTRLKVFLSSTTLKPQDQHCYRQQRACYNCGETTHLSKYCPKHCKDTSKQAEICNSYNRFSKSHCEKDDNKCSNGRQHKCQRCNKWGCKAIRQTELAQQACLVVVLHPMRSLLSGSNL